MSQLNKGCDDASRVVSHEEVNALLLLDVPHSYRLALSRTRQHSTASLVDGTFANLSDRNHVRVVPVEDPPGLLRFWFLIDQNIALVGNRVATPDNNDLGVVDVSVGLLLQ